MKRTILASIRTGKTFKYVSAFVAISILTQCISPTVAWALTSGPAQEEFASFEPATTTDMVDLYSGDFNYNIPLLSVPGPNGGYPINLAYHSGIGMEQEGSWAGLGWNVNVGAINRQLRGLPDDFKGDEIDQKMNVRDNVTAMLGYTIQKKVKFFGIPKPGKDDFPLSLGFQMYCNSYRGLGTRVSVGTPREVNFGVASMGLGISYDSQDGLGIEPNMTVKGRYSELGVEYKGGFSYNSRSGIQSFALTSSLKLGLGDKHVEKIKDQGQLANDMGYGRTSSMSFSTSQSIPSVSIPMNTTTVNMDIKLSKEEFWDFGQFKYRMPVAWSGAVATSTVANNGEVKTAAYGYLYTGESTKSTDMRDFQRKPIEYSKNVPYLAPSSFTYDLYTQTGQGAGGMFRPYYSSVGSLSTPSTESKEIQTRFNLEGGVGPDKTPPSTDVHICVGATYVKSTTTSGNWSQFNNLSSNLKFEKEKSGDLSYEPFYFKQYGEKSGILLSDDQLELKWGGDKAVRAKLLKVGSWQYPDFQLTNDFVNNPTQASNPLFHAGNDQKYRKQRLARASNIEMLTDDQAAIYGGKQEQFGSTGNIPNKTFDHTHKISEISILQSDGMRYTYGLPAYNNNQMEAVFSVKGSDLLVNTNNVPVPHAVNDKQEDVIVPYSGDATYQTDKYLMQTSMNSAYAHSWLLTSVVSADYIDLTGDGPTNDDYGYWVKFNYQKTATNYKWRVPYSGANYIEGRSGEFSDDKASFTYGEKEIYFLSSVETKTHVAFFETDSRLDCIPATGKYAVKGTDADATNNPMKSLRNIKLYAKNGLSGHASTPIKTVNFTYSYRLCQQTENAANERDVNLNKGKLTLDKVSFTYQNSDRGELSAYKFKYGDAVLSNATTDNPLYNLNNMDRWGNYKNNNYSAGSYPYKEFPYTNQNGAPDVSKWNLTQIDLPTGGSIKVNYESDDYGYVEDKKATHMFDIIGIGNAPTALSNRDDSPVKKGATEVHNGGDGGNFRVYFKLEQDITLLTNKQAYMEEHVKDIDKIYFKLYAELRPGRYDYVTGYATVAGTGPSNVGYETINNNGVPTIVGYVTVLAENLKKHAIAAKKVNPFTKAAIQHLRISRPELVYEGSGIKGGGALTQLLNLIGSVGSTINDLTSMVQGFNTWAYANGAGQQIQLSGRSVIRLNDPDGVKYGGGIRVAKISISDNWDATTQDVNLSTTSAKEYGQKYDYLIQEGSRMISSGVAYEPTVGGDESALRTPKDYEESILLGTTSNLHIDNPILEEYYPGASVGYRKVTVTSIGADQADLSDNNQKDGSLKIERSSAPIAIYEFYSPKDFPVIMDETDMSADPAAVRRILIPGIYSSYTKKMARSQGYSIILNDMAGKTKSVTYRTRPSGLNTEGALISKEEYIYNTDAPYSDTRRNKLSNRVQVLTVNGAPNYETVYQTGVIGQSHDVFVDENETKQESKGFGVDVNLTLKITPPTAYIPVLVPLPYASESYTGMNTVVTMKVIQRSGILKKVITTTEESVITKESLAFDLQTGKPLLTKVTNEFKDAVYQFAYPAYWYHQTMGGAYKNYGITVTSFSPNLPAQGWLHIGADVNVNTYFNEGDELLVNNSFKAHVTAVDGVSNYIRLVKLEGGYVSGEISSLKIIASGRKNLLDAETGKTLSQEVPDFSQTVQNDPAVFHFNKIIDASAIEYKDQWKTMCKNCNVIPNPNEPKDPYTTGERGIWRPFISYAYKTARVYTDDQSRKDGLYADFTQFPWFNPAQKSAKWIAANTITEYSPYGFELENKNAIGIYSSAVYGYDQSSPVAVAKNAQFKELLFDGFEDYYSGNCMDHYNIPFRDRLTLEEKHTGKSSMRLEPGDKVAVEANLKNCAR